MKLMMLGGAAGIMCGGLYMSGAFAPGEVYPIPVKEVRAEVARLPAWKPLDEIFSGNVAQSAHVETEPDGSVVWRFTGAGRELGVVRATITEEGPAKTRVTVAAHPGDALAQSSPIGKVIATDMVQDLIELAMAEQIDSALEKRPFDRVKLDAAARSYVVSHPREAAAFRQVAAETFASHGPEMIEMDEQMGPATHRSSDMPSAYFGTTRPMTEARPMTSARPMVDVRPADDRYGRYR